MSTALVIALLLSLGPEASVTTSTRTSEEPRRELPLPALERWLARPGPPSARSLEHGVFELGLAGGTPHLYRLDLSLGLFDVATVGVTAHWLPGQAWPQTQSADRLDFAC